MRKGRVYINGVEAGVLIESDAPKSYTFKYDEDYLKYGKAPVCLLMPLREEEYRSENLFPYFSNILSEGENRNIQSEQLRIDKNDDFGILLATAGNDTIGAVTVKRINADS